jgi:endonuclease/exonuclease/phosphatase family metal-dependent hydrolase
LRSQKHHADDRESCQHGWSITADALAPSRKLDLIDMRIRTHVSSLALASALVAAGVLPTTGPAHANPPGSPCESRPGLVSAMPFTWFAAPQEDAEPLEQWCRGVGIPVVTATPDGTTKRRPTLDELVVVSWNAHLAEGQLTRLIADLRAGRLTEGEPVEHFVLLLQELYRRGDVPPFVPNARSAYAITARDPKAPDARDYAAELGLAVTYVPSMRNGHQMAEDRGNAIISTEPLLDLFALELPFERQRRVAAGAAILVETEGGPQRLQLIDAHLEPLAAPSSLWLFRNPRKRQIAAILDLLQQPRFERDSIGTVLGGDFNTVQGGTREDAYRRARAWSRSLGVEDLRSTHLLGRLDYVFARLAPGWLVDTTRIGEKYGSDHHPVLARFRR